MKKIADKYSYKEEKIYEGILLSFSNLLKDFKRSNDNLFNEVFKRNSDHPFIYFVSLFPYQCLKSISKKNSKQELNIIKELGIAHLAGWTGYTIIDGIIDKQQKSDSLPLSVFLIRYMCEIVNLHANTNCKKIIETILNDTDSEYYNPNKSWNFKSISLRSLGHSIPAIIIASRYGASQSQLSITLEYFRYYLACRQLADDARDWKEDIIGKRDTPLTIFLRNKLGSRKIKLICNDKINHLLLAEISSITINRISPLMISWTKKALKHLSQSPYRDSTYFRDEVLNLQGQATRALDAIKLPHT